MSGAFTDIEHIAHQRRISRLCHFTPSRNLIQIAMGQVGVLSTKRLKEDERSVYTATDLARLDGYEGYVCCSVEYPNAWYLDRLQVKELLFPDWVILFISPKYLWQPGTLFCPRNAAAHGGRLVSQGLNGFQSLYSPSVIGAQGATYQRSATHLTCSPTDDQAEILVPDRVSLENIRLVAVASEPQARRELARLQLAGVARDTFTFVVAPILFQKRELSRLIRAGQRPVERVWAPGESDDDG